MSNNTPLLEAQEDLLEGIRNPEAAQKKGFASRHFSGSLFASAERGLEAYQNNFFVRIFDLLQGQLPVFCAIMGEKAVWTLVRGFLRKANPTAISLDEISGLFVRYLKTDSYLDQYAPDPKVLMDVARFDFLISLLPSLESGRTAKITERHTPRDTSPGIENTHVRLKPALILARFDFPVDEIRNQFLNDRFADPPLAEKKHLVIFLGEEGQAETHSLLPWQFRTLQSLKKGMSLFELYERLHRLFPKLEAPEFLLFLEAMAKLHLYEFSLDEIPGECG